MKRHDPRWDDVSITPSCGNVFVDLGFDEDEAHVMMLRAELMISIEKRLAKRGMTQAEAAKEMGIKPTRGTKLNRRVLEKASFEMLVMLAVRLGLRPELKLAV